MITITEALAETKTLAARIEKRHDAVLRYLVRDARLRDPLEADGGTFEFVKRERQAIGDLEERLVAIRGAIQKANIEISLTINSTTRTVSGWLNWRREVSELQKRRMAQMVALITQARQKAAQSGVQLVQGDAHAQPPGGLIVALNEKDLSEAIENLESILGELDGKLSLLNATTLIEV